MFKVGDKVIVVNAESVGGYYENGDVGVVSKIDSNLHGYVTRNDGVEMNVYWREVELYKHPVVFQAGDRVKFTESSLASGMIDAKEDDVFTVKESYKRTVTLKELQGHYHVTHFEHVQEEVMDNTEEQEIDWQVGQDVFCLLRGKGVVDCVGENDGATYVVGVDFGYTFDNYTVDGKIMDDHRGRVLFFSEPKIEAEKFPPKKLFVPTLKKGDVILAKDYREFRVIRVSREDEYFVYNEDGTGFGKSGWEFRTLGEEIVFN